MTKPVPLSKRAELCDFCGHPGVVCPAFTHKKRDVGRRFIRCCDGCTHRTQVDVEYEEHFPDHADYYGRAPHPYPDDHQEMMA